MLEEHYHPERFGLSDDFAFSNIGSEDREEEVVQLTFKQLYERTNKKIKLKITGTNVTQKSTLEFSVDTTLDFPVVDAVCLSSAFPMAFKPTFVNAWVDRSKAADHPDNIKYFGFYVDGGMLNNIPLHFFDKEEVKKNGIAYYGLEGVLGIGLNKKVDTDDRLLGKNLPLEYLTGTPLSIVLGAMDSDLRKINNPKYFEELFEKKTSKFRFVKNGDGIKMEYILNDGKVTELDTLFDHVGNLLGIFMYPMEHGQFRTAYERDNHYIELSAYLIETLDFNPNPDLTLFAQKRAFQKLFHKLDFQKYLKQGIVLPVKFSNNALIPLYVFPVV